MICKFDTRCLTGVSRSLVCDIQYWQNHGAGPHGLGPYGTDISVVIYGTIRPTSTIVGGPPFLRTSKCLIICRLQAQSLHHYVLFGQIECIKS